MVVSEIVSKQTGVRLMVPNTLSGLSLFYADCVGSKQNLLICPLVKPQPGVDFPAYIRATVTSKSVLNF